MILTQVHFCPPVVTFVATREQTLFLLWALYKAEFSTDRLQIHILYSLDQDLDSYPVLLLIICIGGHSGANFVFHVHALNSQVLKGSIHTMHSLDQGLDADQFLGALQFHFWPLGGTIRFFGFADLSISKAHQIT